MKPCDPLPTSLVDQKNASMDVYASSIIYDLCVCSFVCISLSLFLFFSFTLFFSTSMSEDTPSAEARLWRYIDSEEGTFQTFCCS